MITLTIYTSNLTAIEVINGSNVKYIESFDNWNDLLVKLGESMQYYTLIMITASDECKHLY